MHLAITKETIPRAALAKERTRSYKTKLNPTIFKGMRMMGEKIGSHIQSGNQSHYFVKFGEKL